MCVILLHLFIAAYLYICRTVSQGIAPDNLALPMDASHFRTSWITIFDVKTIYNPNLFSNDYFTLNTFLGIFKFYMELCFPYLNGIAKCEECDLSAILQPYCFDSLVIFVWIFESSWLALLGCCIWCHKSDVSPLACCIWCHRIHISGFPIGLLHMTSWLLTLLTDLTFFFKLF